MFSSWTIFNCRFLLDILTQACTEWDLDSCSDSDSCIWICVQIQILGSLKSVNLFDGQFTCWAICLKYHILTYGHITAGPPANISFCVWGVAADDNDRNAIDDDDYDGDDDDESDLKIWVAPAASTAAVTRSFPPTATGSTLRLLVMMMIVVVLMMAMVVMVVTKRLTTEMMKVIKMIMLLALLVVGYVCWPQVGHLDVFQSLGEHQLLVDCHS